MFMNIKNTNDYYWYIKRKTNQKRKKEKLTKASTSNIFIYKISYTPWTYSMEVAKLNLGVKIIIKIYMLLLFPHLYLSFRIFQRKLHGIDTSDELIGTFTSSSIFYFKCCSRVWGENLHDFFFGGVKRTTWIKISI